MQMFDFLDTSAAMTIVPEVHVEQEDVRIVIQKESEGAWDVSTIDLIPISRSLLSTFSLLLCSLLLLVNSTQLCPLPAPYRPILMIKEC